MFELRYGSDGRKVLVFVRRDELSEEEQKIPRPRGMWVEIGHEREKEINYFIEFNRSQGLQVERDERGFWRALILTD
ncbi:MAG: hypothetical protein OIN85_01030 [Candidatus Methanoperedens sp.]|nr:hypothetical protein [Candidatus Methanoperedens sp.]